MVPVLSKQQTSTRPANGILNGSVQKIAKKPRQYNRRLPVQNHKLTKLAERHQTRIHRQTQLHRQLGRHDTRNNQDTVEEELVLLQPPLETLGPDVPTGSDGEDEEEADEEEGFHVVGGDAFC